MRSRESRQPSGALSVRYDGGAMRILGSLLLVLAAAGPAGGEGPPTNLLAVDEFIDAPLAVFGRTRTAVERALGLPAAVQVRALPGGRRIRIDPVDELSYPGVVVGVSRTSADVRRVEISEARWPLPRGLNVGVPRSRVTEVLGEPQAASDTSVLYLYSDAYPDTVEFYFRDNRVHRIEWQYAATD
jgi:hypothetical protein